MAVKESAEVRREKWLRGDWRWFTDKLPSKEYVRSKLPRDRQEWILALYAGFVIGGAIFEIIRTGVLNHGKAEHAKPDA